MTLTTIKQESIRDTLDDSQLFNAAIKMEECGGGFASCIGRAFMRADNTNAEKLLRAFPDLFLKFAPRKEEDPYE